MMIFWHPPRARASSNPKKSSDPINRNLWGASIPATDLLFF
jgi:hypothetical protein